MQQVADEDLLIQQLTSQALMDEAEADRILFESSGEQAIAQLEYAKAEAEYQKALQEVVDQQEANIALINASTGAVTEAEMVKEGDDLYKNLYAESEQIYLKRKKAEELQALGLIPMDATSDQMAGYVDLITQRESEKPTFLSISKSGDVINTVDGAKSEAKIRKHKALVKAHNEFQKTYKKDIMEFRYGFKRATPQYENDVITTLDDLVYVEYAKQYLPFGSPSNKNPRDGKLFRVNQRITPSSFAPNRYMYIEYVYDPAQNVWNPQGSWQREKAVDDAPEAFLAGAQLGYSLPEGDPIINTAKFTIDGRFPEGTEIPQTAGDGFNGLFAMFRNGFTQGKWNTKRAYQKCKPGYWFFEELPEEASHCVYMGGTMVDTDASYYPASVGFDYRDRKDTTPILGGVVTSERLELLRKEEEAQAEYRKLQAEKQRQEELAYRRSLGINV